MSDRKSEEDMVIKFSGIVLFANGVPAEGVRVRVYDKDEPGKGDDDLTTEEGVSDEEGKFTVGYKPSRYRDSSEHDLAGLRARVPFDLSPDRVSRFVPDSMDIYQPYLEFQYDHMGRPRRHTAWMVPFVRRIRLPEAQVPAAPFRPSKHGFKFVNRFPGHLLPISIPDMPDLRKIPAAYGLCGGMASAACDFYLAERTPPSITKVPRKGTSLHRYLFQRQIDTFGAYGEYLVKLAYWMALPDDTIDGTQKRTHDEFKGIRSWLDDRIPVVLCLVYVGFDETLEMWENHQVLAYQYEEALPNVVRIGIYDPNYPKVDDVHIKCERISVGSRLISGPSPRRATVYGLRCTQVVRAKDWIVRGFFMMPYEPVVPRAGL